MKRTSLIAMLLSLSTVLTTGCGSLTTTAKTAFKVRMQGIYSTPVGAAGDSAPQSETFLLNGVTLTAADGTVSTLYTEDPATYKIIDRPQLLYANYDMADYDGITFSKASVIFDTSVVVTTKKSAEINIALDSGTLDLVQSFTIDKSTTQTLTIKASWGKTVTSPEGGTETAVAPTFAMTFTSD